MRTKRDFDSELYRSLAPGVHTLGYALGAALGKKMTDIIFGDKKEASPETNPIVDKDDSNSYCVESDYAFKPQVVPPTVPMVGVLYYKTFLVDRFPLRFSVSVNGETAYFDISLKDVPTYY
ncbi:MAG: hypothetical protein IT291_09730 [Deltaproteobacteria bacterium]|nr:hypothetical protein [Deltaproteobacteria bacterium]